MYYRLQLTDRGTDNPDQRIAEDLRLFADLTLTYTLDLISTVITLASFFGILWVLSGTLSFMAGAAPVSVPGYLVWVALIYAVAGTWLTHRIGKPLIRLHYDQQRFEADLRYALVRFRENAEGIALYHGEADEKRNFVGRFRDVMANWWEIMQRRKKLAGFTNKLCAARNHLPVHRGRAAFFLGCDPARWPDADSIGIPGGANRIVVVRRCVCAASRVEGDRRSADWIS